MSQADDKIMEDLLRRRRDEGPPLGGPLCGDAELLAAFAEDALAGRSRVEMESHLAACSPCREAVARLVRLAPRPVVAAPVPQVAGWKRWVWAAPALAGVVLVGSFVMFNRQRIVEPPRMIASQQTAAPSTVPQPPAAEPRANESARPEAAAKSPRRASSDVKEEARAAAPTPAPPVSVVAEREQDKKEELKADLDAQKVQTQEQAFRAKDAAGARQSQARDQSQIQPAPAPSQQQVQVFAKAPAEGATVGGTAAGSGQAKAAGPMLRSMPSTAKPGAETVAAEPAAMRVLADDRLDKADQSKKLGLLLSADTKIAQTVRVRGTRQVWNLLADGRLLLSLDGGTTWKEVAVPERPKSVTARDAGHAEIIAVSGLVYRTTDAGASWTQVRSR